MKPTLVPEGGTVLDVLAQRYRAAINKMEGGREQWIEGTLELAAVVAEARMELPDHRSFSHWLQRYGLVQIHPNDRAALIGFAKDPAVARKMLEKSNSISWRVIWENREKFTPTNFGKGEKRRAHRDSGHRQRNRPIPTVMRDDLPPPPPRKQFLSDLLLTREQVDPDFKGGDLEFAATYGPVLLNTKQQIEKTKRQDALMRWVGTIADHERTGRAMLAALADVDPTTLAEWTSKPSKAEKLRAWCDSIQVACEAIRKFKGTT